MTGIYLDWNATAPPNPQAMAVWMKAQQEYWGNPSSIHSYGQAARHHWDAARATVGRIMGCRASSVVFTGSGTEANNLAIHAALNGQESGQVIAAAIDHSSILRPLAAAHQQRLITLCVDHAARIDAQHLAQVLGPDTRLVCLQLANNETGTIQDVAALAAMVRERAEQAHIHVDACQGAGKIPIVVSDLGVDTVSMAGHKLGAPKGTGALLCLKAGPLAPLLHGGQQQSDRRSGTEDVAGALALASALASAADRMGEECARQQALLEDTFAVIVKALPAARWLAHDAQRLPNTLSLGCAGLRADPLLMRLDLAGICVSRGSACMAARREPSHVIQAMGLEPALAASVIRLSIGSSTTVADCQRFAETYIDLARQMT